MICIRILSPRVARRLMEYIARWDAPRFESAHGTGLTVTLHVLEISEINPSPSMASNRHIYSHCAFLYAHKLAEVRTDRVFNL